MKHEAEQFNLPLPGVPPVQEKAPRQQVLAEARNARNRCYYTICTSGYDTPEVREANRLIAACYASIGELIALIDASA